MNILLIKNKSSQQTATYFALNMPPQTSTVWQQLTCLVFIQLEHVFWSHVHT